MLLPSDGAHIPVINVGTRKYQIPDFIFFAVAGARRWLHGEERWLHGRSWVTRRGRWHSVADLDQKWKLQPLQWLSGEQRMVRAEWQLAEELEGKEWRGWKRRKRLMVGGKLEKGTKKRKRSVSDLQKWEPEDTFNECPNFPLFYGYICTHFGPFKHTSGCWGWHNVPVWLLGILDIERISRWRLWSFVYMPFPQKLWGQVVSSNKRK